MVVLDDEEPGSSGNLQKAAAETELDAAARLLHWAEERLIGPYEDCCDCLGMGHDVHLGQMCASCYGEGNTPRSAYINVELALTPEQRRQIGEDELLTSDSSAAVARELRGM